MSDDSAFQNAIEESREINRRWQLALEGLHAIVMDSSEPAHRRRIAQDAIDGIYRPAPQMTGIYDAGSHHTRSGGIADHLDAQYDGWDSRA